MALDTGNWLRFTDAAKFVKTAEIDNGRYESPAEVADKAKALQREIRELQ